MISYDHEPKILQWNDVKTIFGHYLGVWGNHIPLNWACLAWNALVRGGLCVYQNEDEEHSVLSCAVALSLIYYEYASRTGWAECSNFNGWSVEEINNLKSDFLNDQEQAEEMLGNVRRCLWEQIGEEELPFELWINCQESHQQHVISTAKKLSMHRLLVGEQNVDDAYERGYDFLKGGDVDTLERYQSISGL